MSEYSTVDFSVLLLMGTYMLSSFCSWQRQTFCESSSWSLCPVCLSIGNSHPRETPAPSYGPSSSARVLLTLGVPCPLGTTVRAGIVHSRSPGAWVMVSCGFSVFLLLWRSRGISGKDTKTGRWEKLWGPAWGWNLHMGGPLCLPTHTQALLAQVPGSLS